jgi:hypothetical protein
MFMPVGKLFGYGMKGSVNRRVHGMKGSRTKVRRMQGFRYEMFAEQNVYEMKRSTE